MALRFIDSVQHYGTTIPGVLQRKWTNVSGVGVQLTGGRRANGPCLNGVGGGNGIWKTLTHQSRYVIGAAIQNFNAGSLLGFANNQTIVAFLQPNNDNTLSVKGGTNGAILGSSTLAVSNISEWHYYEIDCTFGEAGTNVTCTATVWVDSSIFISTSGTLALPYAQLIDGSATVNQVGVYPNGGNTPGGVLAQDFYCVDATNTDANGYSTTNTAHLGDVEIDALFPDADVTTNWGSFGGDGTHAYTCVDDTPGPDDDTSYVYTTATGSSEAFNYQPISTFTGTIIGAQYLVCVKKTAEGERVIELTVGGNPVKTIEYQGTSNYLSDYYTYFIASLDTDNGVAWTPTVFDAEVFGITLQT